MTKAARRPRTRFRAFFALLLLLVIGAGAWVVSATRYVPPPVPVDTSPRAVARAREILDEATDTLVAARRDVRAGRERPYRVTIPQTDVNTLLRTDPKVQATLQKRGVERPRIEIADDRLKASGLVRVNGQRVFITAEGSVATGTDGRLAFRPETVMLGRLRAPAALTEEIARRAEQAFHSGALKLPGQVESVRLENGTLIIEGRTTPSP